MKIIVTHDDGQQIDITDGVLAAYDVAYGSMDWGSGFLSTEDMELIAHLAKACRLASFEDAMKEITRMKDAELRRQEFERKAAAEAHRLKFQWEADRARSQAELEARVAAYFADPS